VSSANCRGWTATWPPSRAQRERTSGHESLVIGAARCRAPSGAGLHADQLGVGFVTAAIPPIVDSEILPFGLPLHGVFMSLGAGLAAFLVTAAFSGRAGVADLTRRSGAGEFRCAGT
jgi:hypothetical protein